jgi:hypothetical protein
MHYDAYALHLSCMFSTPQSRRLSGPIIGRKDVVTSLRRAYAVTSLPYGGPTRSRPCVFTSFRGHVVTRTCAVTYLGGHVLARSRPANRGLPPTGVHGAP